MDFYRLQANATHKPVLELIVRASDNNTARIVARQFVKTLASVGYDRFDLWDMRPGELLAQNVCTYSVTRRVDEVVEDYWDEKQVRRGGII